MDSNDKPVTVIESNGKYRLNAVDGTLIGEGSGKITLQSDALCISTRFGEPLYYSLRDISSINPGDYRFELVFVNGEKLEVSELGLKYEDVLREINKQLKAVGLKDRLVDESNRLKGIKAGFEYLSSEGKPLQSGSAEIQIYETSLAILPELSGMIKIRLSEIIAVQEGDYSLQIKTESGQQVILNQMAGKYDTVIRELSAAMQSLSQTTQAFIKDIDPSLTPAVVRGLGKLIGDGRAVAKQAIDDAAPSFWRCVELRYQAAEMKDYLNYLLSKGNKEAIYLGVKRGLMGDESGDYLWCLVPFYSTDSKQPGNAIAMEAVSSNEDSGRATYFFRITGRKEYPACQSMEELKQLTAATVKVINQAMLAINFRREPIYLEEAKLIKETRDYRYSVTAIPELKVLRDLFIGRVIHSSPEQWTLDVQELLQFNLSAKDDTLKWIKPTEE